MFVDQRDYRDRRKVAISVVVRAIPFVSFVSFVS